MKFNDVKSKKNLKYLYAIKEIRFVLTFNSIIQLIFTLALSFITAYTLAFFFHFYPLMSAISVTVFVFFYKINEIRADYMLMQKKYPKIADAIQAFKDTINEEGYLVEKLREDVIAKLKEVRNGDFFDYSLLYKKTSYIIFVFIVLILITLGNFQFSISNKLSSFSIELPSIDDLFSDNSTINKTNKVKLNRANDNMEFKFKKHFDLSVQKDIEEKEFEDSSVPVIEIGSDDIYVEQISNDEKDTVKKYFENINK